ncbi:hypothetical protein BGZ63DRAFT_399375 [Mariannaea sp. PMI_226]|nr:hypothetical protein BGZ63DRAFT_399375 [Mariannaea sp. PMI_226]
MNRESKIQLIKLLKEQFKDEMKYAGIFEDDLVMRHLFPGIAIQCVGEVTPERVAIACKIDNILITEIKKAGIYKEPYEFKFNPLKKISNRIVNEVDRVSPIACERLKIIPHGLGESNILSIVSSLSHQEQLDHGREENGRQGLSNSTDETSYLWEEPYMKTLQQWEI